MPIKRMPVIGSGDGDGVDGLVLQHVADIGIGLGVSEAEFGGVLETLGDDILIDIHHGGEFHAGYFLYLLQMSSPGRAGPPPRCARDRSRRNALRRQQGGSGGGFQHSLRFKSKDIHHSFITL